MIDSSFRARAAVSAWTSRCPGFRRCLGAGIEKKELEEINVVLRLVAPGGVLLVAPKLLSGYGGSLYCPVIISTKEMALRDHPDLQRILAHLTIGMLSYMDSGNSSYEEEDIDTCRGILGKHADQLESVSDRRAALAIVESTVNQLNQLNKSAGHDLIETDQREDICAYIIRAGALRGFNGDEEDVTEEWREW